MKYRAIISDELAIDDAGRDLIIQVSEQALLKAREYDNEAQRIIAEDRRLYPDGKIQGKDSLPKMPLVLETMQQARTSVFLDAIEKLGSYYGASDFQSIDSKIRACILSKIHSRTA